jgi:hypothetical protein
MGRLEVQGIVSAQDGLPRVQFRQLNDENQIEAQWQTQIIEAREMAQQIVEAAMNAVYDAAVVTWAKEVFPDNWQEVSSNILITMRNHRADRWGLPDQPEDWR